MSHYGRKNGYGIQLNNLVFYYSMRQKKSTRHKKSTDFCRNISMISTVNFYLNLVLIPALLYNNYILNEKIEIFAKKRLHIYA
jgi:hypothetical protein